MDKKKDIMNENVQEQAGIRKYLLGILDDEAEMRQTEEKILLDDKFADTVSIAEEKLIEDFLDGSLEPDQREKFVKFFLSTPRRRQQFRLTRNFRRYSANAPKPAKAGLWSRITTFFSAPIPALAGAACCILIFVAVGYFFFQRSDTYPYLSPSENQIVTELLNQAYKRERPFEARISNLGYAPHNVTRGEKAPPVDQRELNAAERIAVNSGALNTIGGLRNAGRVNLVKGDLDQAISQFKKARELAPARAPASAYAEILNDLGVALLEKSSSVEKSDSGLSLKLALEALDSFSKAMELAPGFLEAHFNKALCLQQMGRNAEAKKAWEEYVVLDPASPWTDEAKQAINSLSSKEQPAESLP
jgi:tetratricopeptide (TPR) repeat protein